MKYLSICIPNYNRLGKLEKLIHACAKQILESSLEQKVEICISDDCSTENPSELITKMEGIYSGVSFRYVRNEVNKGMDYNFLNSVLISDGLYCWIIGNDDLPEDNGILQAFTYLKERKEQIDILITPFNVYSEEDEYRTTVYPFGDTEGSALVFDTKRVTEYQKLIKRVQHNSALFGFLSNVIFKREKWEEYEVRFQDKLHTIFIQMYMNIQTLQDGAMVEYFPKKIIRNYADDETNASIERICRILIGLDGVIEYFFDGREKESLKRIIVDAYISGIVWELPEENVYKEKIRKIVSGKNSLYKEYFIPVEQREQFFSKRNVLIYGAGNYGRKVYEEVKGYDAMLEGIADSDTAKRGMKFADFNVMSIDEMLEVCFEKDVTVLVASHFGLEVMIKTLLENKVEKIAIIS